MSEFTYEVPNEKKFLQAVLILIRQNGNSEIASLLSDSKLTITKTSSFSKVRWNAYYTIVDFSVPPRKYEKVVAYISGPEREIIKTICNKLMPLKSGLDIMEVNFSISLDDLPEITDPMKDLERISNELPEQLKIEIIPQDIRIKAKEMSEVYLYTYCAENSLRAFIEKIAVESYGTDYISKLKLSRDMQTKITVRKEQQLKKKWLSTRGSSDIFYLDIEDLGNLIQNNWDIFKRYFESTQWITTNIGEIAACRNAVAHHSYLQEYERLTVRLNFIKILKQIEGSFK